MQKDLLALRQEAENSFNNLQTSLNSIKAELQKYGLETIEEGYAELNRLQGEFRALNKVIDKKKPKPDVIDATEVDSVKEQKNG